ncbi:class I SAM-dependent RNA methyltransferase [Cumulibacter manganitolerans]|uniref:class I SAM-dependent RNA methyltransferase n=1 Tax=Cumulibacter manganitolerans TaxID=1884992 RepID=UPI0012967C8F|nr:class I SAM-dependent RNA methyltransferase [Cumulibacter manganitolerans]
MAESWAGREVVVDVERVAHGGHCVARHEGRVLFVRHTLPGERVRALVTEDGGGSFCRADAVEVLRASPDRVAAPCRYARPGGCGGCDWQHVDPAAQRRLKQAVVTEQLQRLAGLDVDVRVEEVAPAPLHWRTRMQYAVDGERLGLRAHRSHDVIEIDSCPIAVPEVDAPVARERAVPGAVTIEVEAADDGAIAVSAVDARRRRRALAGGPVRHDTGGRRYEVRTGGFWQVHVHAADVLLEAVLELADVQAGESIVDLYCGAGLFTAALAERTGPTGRVIGVEGTASAVRDGRRNVSDLRQCEIVRGSIDARTVDGFTHPVDVVVLDPPRAGAKRPLVEAICRLDARAVVYVACDPAALARDVAAFAGCGWRLERLRAFDLFPMTQHVECVALLVPEPGGAPPPAGGPLA